MDQSKRKENRTDQVIVKGKWVEKQLFRSWMYGHNDQMRLVESHAEYQEALASGKWFADKPVVSPKVRKQKDADADS